MDKAGAEKKEREARTAFQKAQNKYNEIANSLF